MTFSNIKWIFLKEVRDQLRDRRTLFMIAVLPILLYPLLGMSLLQVAQFVQKQTTRVLVVGADNLKGSAPALFEKEQFADDCRSAKLLELQLGFPRDDRRRESADARAEACALVQSGAFEAALYFPPDFSARLDAFRQAILHRAENPGSAAVPAASSGRDARAPADARDAPLEVPSPEILHNTANDKSRVAFLRLREVLGRWTQRITDDNLRSSGVSASAMQPFSVGSSDVADAKYRSGALWSKVLPILMLLWALTGAFYPAVDLCAGEKERGTLETLLSSPAARCEIVLGKLLTIMLFSIATAVLNLASMGITAQLVVAQVPGFGLPPLTAVLIMGFALLPIAALFSALCLALAAFARSTKEGQCYLMPLLMLTMPLVILPMAPGVELNVGNSLIPVTGIVLLLRSVLEGDYWPALQYSPIVAAVTLVACLMAIRWAVEQFNSEAVLFRESERWDLRLWVRRLLRDRRPTPSPAAAVCCGLWIVMAQFLVSCSSSAPAGIEALAHTFLVPQLLVIVPPMLLMTLLVTTSPRETLLLKRPVSWLAVPAAALLAAVLHPTANLLQNLVQRLYPVSEEMLPQLTEIQKLLGGANLWVLLLLIAVVPAVCEELAFRGFILSGFRHLGHKRRAVLYSALLFGLAHGILQQSLIASLVGIVLGYVAVQSGSILPCMVFHLCHNALAIVNSRITPTMFPDWPLLRAFATPTESVGCTFAWPTIVAGAMAAYLLLAWFNRLSGGRSRDASLPMADEAVPFVVVARLGNDAV
jgi:sodium transport system permease protein